MLQAKKYLENNENKKNVFGKKGKFVFFSCTFFLTNAKIVVNRRIILLTHIFLKNYQKNPGHFSKNFVKKIIKRLKIPIKFPPQKC